MLAIRLPSEVEDRLVALAKATRRTKTFYARQAIVEYLGDMEDTYLAEQTLERVQRGEEPTYTLSKVEQELGLED